jgi:hypothetical protein
MFASGTKRTWRWRAAMSAFGGSGVFEYDQPSSFFGQFGDERVTEVGRYLDATLETVLRNAAQ